jgi:hypothetical protein
MELVKFGSWPEVMAHAQAGRPLYYQAPLNHQATRFLPGSNQSFSYQAKGRTIRMWPPGSTGHGKSRTADPFNADSKHLDRFSRPAEQKVESSGVVRQGRTVRSKRQPSLPGFPDIPEKAEIEIPDMPQWEQIDGDMSPGAYGGTIARTDTSSLGKQIELLKIQPVREHVGDKDAVEVGFPFWTREASYTIEDLTSEENIKNVFSFIGMDHDQFEELTPTQRALTVASALMDYGTNVDEGPAGWSSDLPNFEVKWSSGETANLRKYLEDEDDEFKNDVLGYDEIRSNIEAEVQKMVDESGAQGWSQLGDQLMMDLDDAGYDGNSAWVIAAFGNEPMIAVNTDTTYSADFAKELGVPSTKNNVYIWSETGTRELEAWLEKQGYEVVHRFGGDVPSTEGYAVARFVIQAVAREMDLDEDVVQDAAKGIDWWPADRGHGDQEIPGSTDGDTTVWAKKVRSDEDEEVEERRSPRRRR